MEDFMNSATATLTKEINFSFDHDNSESLEMPGILSTLRLWAHRVWLGLSWRAQALTAGLLMTMASFSLSMLVAFLSSL
jgi:hypothetical protein